MKKRKIAALVLAGLIVLVAFPVTCRSAEISAESVIVKETPVACSALTTLRALAPKLTKFTNYRTGDSMEYVVVGDGAFSNDVLVMFNGTSGILPDWPIQMITNSATSPKIVKTPAYEQSEDGLISICHDYRLVLFDYPGVGKGKLAGTFTGDDIANDVDAMLDDAEIRYGISARVVDPTGWSLGTHLALKYAFLSPAARPDRVIKDVILIATRPGGNTDGFQDGNQAACVNSILTALEVPDITSSFTKTLQTDAFELIFPYVDQEPYDGVDSGCTATIEGDTIDLSVTTNCPHGSECYKNALLELRNRKTRPWSKTDGVDSTVYNGQRSFDHDWNICYCPTASSTFTSEECSCSDTVDETAANGGVCQTVSTGTTTPNLPITSNCVPLVISGRLTVINGPEDLFIQWTYGQALVEGMQQTLGADKATLVTYDGSDGAGHGILMQHPLWTQNQIFSASLH